MLAQIMIIVEIPLELSFFACFANQVKLETDIGAEKALIFCLVKLQTVL